MVVYIKYINPVNELPSVFTAQRFLIGNKIDKDKLVSLETAEHFAAFHNCEFVFLTSAKTGMFTVCRLKTK